MSYDVITPEERQKRKRKRRVFTVEEIQSIKNCIVTDNLTLRQALAILRITYWEYMANMPDNIKDDIRELTGRARIHEERSGPIIQKILEATITEPVYTPPVKVEEIEEVIPVISSGDKEIFRQQLIAIVNCIADKQQFTHQLKERIKRLVERNFITRHQAGQIEYCLTAVMLIYHKA